MPGHPIHLREGMQIRNFIRALPKCKDWTAERIENGWTDVINALVDRYPNVPPAFDPKELAEKINKAFQAAKGISEEKASAKQTDNRYQMSLRQLMEMPLLSIRLLDMSDGSGAVAFTISRVPGGWIINNTFVPEPHGRWPEESYNGPLFSLEEMRTCWIDSGADLQAHGAEGHYDRFTKYLIDVHHIM